MALSNVVAMPGMGPTSPAISAPKPATRDKHTHLKYTIHRANHDLSLTKKKKQHNTNQNFKQKQGPRKHGENKTDMEETKTRPSDTHVEKTHVFTTRPTRLPRPTETDGDPTPPWEVSRPPRPAMGTRKPRSAQHFTSWETRRVSSFWGTSGKKNVCACVYISVYVYIILYIYI